MAAATVYMKQFRFYNDGNPNNQGLTTYSAYCNQINFTEYAPIVQLGIQSLPGTKFYLNAGDAIVIGSTGIYELDLRNTSSILSALRFDEDSMKLINETEFGYLIVDLVYTGG